MGHLQEKYSTAYFLKKDAEGNSLPYGVEGVESFLQGDLREHDKEILQRLNLTKARVLEFGFGRGETIKYIWEKGAESYTGVDFSEAACSIAREFIDKFAINGPRIFCADAVEFVRNLSKERSPGALGFTVVLMLDFVEHVPRSELKELLQQLRPLLDPNAVIAVNTPEFLFDNDVIADGLNSQGMDSSDFIEETRGMHCNRYTLESLRRFFREIGYEAISQGHYFVLEQQVNSPMKPIFSYLKRWELARMRGVPLQPGWQIEHFEYTHPTTNKAKLRRFDQGGLANVALYVTDNYLEYYAQGNYDPFLIQFLSKFEMTGKVIFDLGGFVGANSLQFARIVGPEGAVCAFEPNPFNLDRFCLNLSENPELGDRISIFPYALSNSEGKIRFRAHRNIDDGISSASHLTGAHTTLSEEALSGLGFEETEVDMVTLDSFTRDTGIVPACLKIDIEGSEHLALAGAIETLQRYQPVLMIELHSIFCSIAVIKTITPLGYVSEVLHVEPDGRCFIGAYVDKDNNSENVSFDSALKCSINLEMVKLELAATQSRQTDFSTLQKELAAQRQANMDIRLALETQRQTNINIKQELETQRQANLMVMQNLDATNSRLQVYQQSRLIQFVYKFRNWIAK